MVTGDEVVIRNQSFKGCNFRDETGLACAKVGHCRLQVLQKGTSTLPYDDQNIKTKELNLNEQEARNSGCKEL